jgi:hypothetical protein
MLASAGYADQVVGNFETGLDSWTIAWAGTTGLGNSSTGATLGSHSMSVLVAPDEVTPDPFWKLRRLGQLNLSSATSITMDVTFVASEWPSDAWLNISKIALLDHTNWTWQEVQPADMTVTKISGADPCTSEPNGNIAKWMPSWGNATWTVSWSLANITKTNDTYDFFIALQQPYVAKASAGRFYIDNIRVVSTVETVTVIGNWEGSSYDSWSAAWEDSPVLAPGNTNGVTRGSGSLSVTTNGGYWCLQRWGSPLVLEGATLKFDLTMLASEWPGSHWTKVAEKIAINSDGPDGWKEYENLATAINRDDGTAATLDWSSSTDARKTYSLDVSDYDYTGATYMQIAITIQGGNGAGHFYFDNALLAYPLIEQPSRLYVQGNKIINEDGNDVVLRGVSLIDVGFQQDWDGGATNMINRLTDPNDTNCGSVGWYTNVIRIPVVPPDKVSGWPHPFDPDNTDLYDLLRTVVDYCASKDVYAIIDWHDIDDMNSARIAEANEFWAYMAPLFADDTHVMFELFNEPINNDGTDEENWAAVKAGMETLIDTIRTYAPNTLLFVGTPRWSQIIGPTADDPVDDPNVVYVTHIYPYHWDSDYLYYTNSIAAAAAAHPVILGEWGFTTTTDTLLDGTITDYGEPLKEFVEGLGIGNIAWVASHDWQPPMYDYNDTNDVWTLLDGEGYMGCFVKDWLHDGWLATQNTSIALTFNRCQVTAGSTQGRDTFEASGTFPSVPPNLLGISKIDVNIVSGADGNDIYTEDCNFSWDMTGNRFIWSTKSTGRITQLILNFRSKTFVIKAQNIDLTGLGVPVHLDFTLGDYILSGEADETIVNGASAIPTRLMRTYQDTLVVNNAGVKNSAGALQDAFYANGDITVQDVSGSNLADTSVVITWADQAEITIQTFTIPAHSFSKARTGNLYKCTQARAVEGGYVTATIDLDKCTFAVLVWNTNLNVTSRNVEFGLSFAEFDQIADVDHLLGIRPFALWRMRH